MRALCVCTVAVAPCLSNAALPAEQQLLMTYMVGVKLVCEIAVGVDVCRVLSTSLDVGTLGCVYFNLSVPK